MRNQRGSALMLVPSLVLVTLMLGGVAVNTGYVLMQQHKLQDEVESAANDAAMRSVDNSGYFQSQGQLLNVDPQLAQSILNSHATEVEGPSMSNVSMIGETQGAEIIVSGRARIHQLFRFLPAEADRDIFATVRAELVRN